MAADPMSKLEHGEADMAKARKQAPALTRLLKMQTRDTYGDNSTLRAAMRVRRRQAKAEARTDAELVAKSSLEHSQVVLLPESAADRAVAAQVRFAGKKRAARGAGARGFGAAFGAAAPRGGGSGAAEALRGLVRPKPKAGSLV